MEDSRLERYRVSALYCKLPYGNQCRDTYRISTLIYRHIWLTVEFAGLLSTPYIASAYVSKCKLAHWPSAHEYRRHIDPTRITLLDTNEFNQWYQQHIARLHAEGMYP